MKKLFVLLLVLSFVLSLSACGKKTSYTIAVPNDPTNEGRALLLLQSNGFLTLKEGAGLDT